MDLREKAERDPSARVWNQSFPSPKVQSVRGALFRNIRHNLSESPRERLNSIRHPEDARPYPVVSQRDIIAFTLISLYV